ncbi:unnamed protein product [Cylicocyclus nassatus]|uniref:DUF7774 domain-containing protein n=1 Tax=Cylicocyclus nassatus TaxID=53992 RepID=A0AA36GZ77_CYLNA|nr:unnamed protein product [Cylicocyclus nassatus]
MIHLASIWLAYIAYKLLQMQRKQPSSPSKHAKRLREMFKIFQRAKEETASAPEQKRNATTESQQGAAPRLRKSSPEVSSSISTSRSRHKKKSGSDTKTAIETSAAEKSASDRRRNIRIKYGIREEDQEKKTQAEEQEEFENVCAVVRPAATKMRKAKLRWKKLEGETPPPASDAEKSCAEGSAELLEDMGETESQEKNRVNEIMRRAGILTKEDVERVRAAEASMTEVQILIIRIQELELANRKAKLQLKRLKKQLREKEKKVEELSSLVAFLQKQNAEREEREEKVGHADEAVAIRGLEIIKRNQLLEQTVHNVERTMLCNFFEAVEPKPNQAIVSIIDKALTYAVDVLLMRPDLFDDFVDNELRLFLLDNQRAKRVLLDVMLAHPEYVPQAWGGDHLMMRQREERLRAEQEKEERKVKPHTTAEDRAVAEEEKPAPLQKMEVKKETKVLRGVQESPLNKEKEAAMKKSSANGKLKGLENRRHPTPSAPSPVQKKEAAPPLRAPARTKQAPDKRKVVVIEKRGK